MTTATEPRPLAALLVAHAQLVPSLTNPRKRFDKARLEELALSMAPPTGILEPLVVRTLSAERAKGLSGPGAFYEIIAGERRWRAAAIAKLAEIPIVIREIPDDQVIKLQLVENKNREDIHALDEAEAMERLLKINKAETPKTIAATIGMSERYVQNRLHYLRLVPDVKEAFRRDEITAGHVDLLMRLPADEQTRAYKSGLYEDVFDYDDDSGKNTKSRQLRSVRGLGDWIAGNVRLPLDAQSPQLELLPDVAQAVTESSKVGASMLVELSDHYGQWQGKGHAPLGRDNWAALKKGETCGSQVRGVLVIGRRRGQILDVCTGVGVCKKHFAHTIKAKPTPAAAGTTKKVKPAQKSAADLRFEKQQSAARAQAQLWDKIKPQAEKLLDEKLNALKPGPVAWQLLGPGLGFFNKKKPTLAQLVKASIEDELYDAEGFSNIAKIVGLNLKPLFAEAERKARFAKMSDQEAGAAAIRQQKTKGKPKRKAGAKK